MLVHVSPKEEDLCETICSLNFATRARSIHLGSEDSTVSKSNIVFHILPFVTLIALVLKMAKYRLNC